jgi:S1-C subfamily serine protease
VTWGDIITSIKGKPVEKEGDLFSALDECRPGEVVEMELQKGVGADAKTRKVQVRLTERIAPRGE